MEDDLARVHPISLRFADAGLEQAFREEQARKLLKPFRTVVIAVFLVLIVIWALLPELLPQVPGASARFATPMLIMLAMFAYAYARSYMQSFLRIQQLSMLLGAWGLAAALVSIDSLLPSAALEGMGLAIIVVHTLNVYALLRLRFLRACLGGWGTAAIYLGYLGYTGTLEGADLLRHASALLVANLFGMIAAYQIDQSARREFIAMRLVGQERERSERLLLNILPAAIAERLKTSSESIADHSADVTVLFADIVGFTPLSANKSPQDLVRLLDRIFSEFDALAEKHGLEKIKTIGDAYMAAAGLPERRADHAPAAARMAHDMLAAVERIAAETGEALALRIGLNSGPVVAGVIGRKKFIYDMWGDTVNTASRMESHGLPGTVHCSEATAELLQSGFALTPRGAIPIQGKGEMRTFLLLPSTADNYA